MIRPLPSTARTFALIALALVTAVSCRLKDPDNMAVITSYSIHYTKLYEGTCPA